MYKRLLTIFLSAVVSLMMMTQVVMAEDVYVTKYGKKYHKKESRFIKGKEVEKLSKEEAEARGYKPSSDFKEEKETDQKAEK